MTGLTSLMEKALDYLKAREERKKARIGSMRTIAERIRDANTMCDMVNEDLAERVRGKK